MSPSGTSSTRAGKRVSLNLVTGLPPPAIAGMGALAVQPMQSWMETVGSSVGRKWGELQKGETFVSIPSPPCMHTDFDGQLHE